MNTDIFKKVLSKEDHRDSLLIFLIENHSQITRKPYSNQEYDDNLLYCIVFSYLAKKDKELSDFIVDSTSDLQTEFMRERIHCLLNDIRTKECENGKQKKFRNSSSEYIFCGNHGTCACQNADFQNKVHSKSEEEKKKIVLLRKKTNKERFGTEVALQNAIIKTKMKNTNMERYGTSSPLGNRDIRRKIEKTNLERYGTEYALGNAVIQQKKIDTMLAIYGVKNPAHVEEFQKRKSETNQSRYGSPSPFGNSNVRNKSLQKNLTKFGASHAMKNEEFLKKFFENNIIRFGSRSPFGNKDVQDKIKQTNLERYGFENPLNNPDILQKKTMTMMERYGSKSPFGDVAVREKAMKTKIERYGIHYYFNEIVDDSIDMVFEDIPESKEAWLSNIKEKWLENRKINPDAKLKNPFSVTRAYYKKVMFWTHFHWRENIEQINPNNFERSYWEYHLDHIYSIRDGFVNNVPPEIVGHWSNLRLIPREENQRKSQKSERKLEDVILLYKSICEKIMEIKK